ncbi:UDP-N-acetylmuramoyl-tripeptide--D-alanyl-D-alanine ligase [Pedobacter sp. UYP30]|uniref:UDP-N-acetylmuramoyl-tripeptide--D-alanyl-D- alanine ligase n=1 Tax=Pedobacter sp. UYP30 TaxID=1756400 RepID=UPI0033917417
MITTTVLFDIFLQHPIVCTDTRNILPDSIFFALKGEHFDANAFAAEALEKGAKFCVIDDNRFSEVKGTLLVPNALKALQELARMYRQHLKIPVIGLTGSNGKTTTKELIHAVLAKKYNAFATHGNLNNHIGVPLSILSIKPEHEIAVIEMGANHQKEIAFLSSIAMPSHGMITNIGLAHLEGFGGIEGVKKGKGELFSYLKATNGYVFLNRDNEVLMEMAVTAGLEKIIYYGTGAANAIKGKLISSDPFIEAEWTNHSENGHAATQLTGSYNFENILAAICIGDFFDLNTEEINAGLSSYSPKNNRSQLTATATNKVICDFYNANPSSMEAALKNLSVLQGNKKAAILGDMFELGDDSAQQHEKIAQQTIDYGFKTSVFIGARFFVLKDRFNALFFLNATEAKDFLENEPIKNYLILLKGSRSMKLEDLLEAL